MLITCHDRSPPRSPARPLDRAISLWLTVRGGPVVIHRDISPYARGRTARLRGTSPGVNTPAKRVVSARHSMIHGAADLPAASAPRVAAGRLARRSSAAWPTAESHKPATR